MPLFTLGVLVVVECLFGGFNCGLSKDIRGNEGLVELREKLGGDGHGGDESGSSLGWQGKAARKVEG